MFTKARSIDVAPTARCKLYREALEIYITAVQVAKDSNDQETLASAAKNAAVTSLELGQCISELDPNTAVTHFKGALEFFEVALQCGNKKSKSWVEQLKNTYWDGTEKALEMAMKLAAGEMMNIVQSYAAVIRTHDVKYMCLCSLLLRLCDVIKGHLEGDECDTAQEYLNYCEKIISETRELTSRENMDDLMKLQQKIDSLSTRAKALVAINTGQYSRVSMPGSV